MGVVCGGWGFESEYSLCPLAASGVVSSVSCSAPRLSIRTGTAVLEGVRWRWRGGGGGAISTRQSPSQCIVQELC